MLPSDLMGLANDQTMRRLLHGSFQLIDEKAGRLAANSTISAPISRAWLARI